MPKKIWIPFSLFILLALVAFFQASHVLRLATVPLISSDSGHLESADAVFILGGESNSRPFEAARIYRAGLARRIGIANEREDHTAELGLKPSDCEIMAAILVEREKIPAEIIYMVGMTGSRPLTAVGSHAQAQCAGLRLDQERLIQIGCVDSTFDESKALRKWCADENIESVILVTNPLYSRRARWIFDKMLGGRVRIQIATTECDDYNSETWWTSEEGLIAVNNEYVKLAYYFWKYWNRESAEFVDREF